MTTHATELKLFGAQQAHVRNASVASTPTRTCRPISRSLARPDSRSRSPAQPCTWTKRWSRGPKRSSGAGTRLRAALDELAQERGATTASARRRARRVHSARRRSNRKRGEALEREREVANRGDSLDRGCARSRPSSSGAQRGCDAQPPRPRVTRGQSEPRAHDRRAAHRTGVDASPPPVERRRRRWRSATRRGRASDTEGSSSS